MRPTSSSKVGAPLTLEQFLAEPDHARVMAAIAAAERRTSGELRVHLDEHCEDDPLDRAAFVFSELGMHRTRQRNGALLYVNVTDRRVAVIGDAGIHQLVGQHFWDDVLELVKLHFIGGRYTEGLIAGVERIGAKLQQHFPWQHDDRNELSNAVSVHR